MTSAPTVVHHDRVVTETAVLCADGRLHTREPKDAEKALAACDAAARRYGTSPLCGGQPHYLAQREHVVTRWERI